MSEFLTWRTNDGEGQALALREGKRFFIVARGPVPRARWSARTMAGETLSDARMASEGPRPTWRGGVFLS